MRLFPGHAGHVPVPRRVVLLPPSRDRLVLHLLLLLLPLVLLRLADRLLPTADPPSVVLWSEADAAKPCRPVSRDDIVTAAMYLLGQR